MIDLLNPSQDEVTSFSVLFERAAGTFVNSSEYHDCCEFLTTQTAFTPVTPADALEIVSSSVNDTANGTGTRTVGVVYLDANGMWSRVIVTMNGTTPVALPPITPSAIIFARALTGGTGQVSAGNITIRKVGAPTTIYEYIAAIKHVTVSAQGQPIEFKIRTTRDEFDGSNTDRFAFVWNVKLASGGSIPSPLHIRLDAGQQFKLSAIADATGGNPRVHGVLNVNLIKL